MPSKSERTSTPNILMRGTRQDIRKAFEVANVASLVFVGSFIIPMTNGAELCFVFRPEAPISAAQAKLIERDIENQGLGLL